jgi:hypothetical protein
VLGSAEIEATKETAMALALAAVTIARDNVGKEAFFGMVEVCWTLADEALGTGEDE